MITTEIILEFLKLSFQYSVDVTYVSKIMRPLELDTAWIYLGGSGARMQIFQLRDNVRVVFQFNGDDRLEAYGVYKNEKSLDEDREHSTLYPVFGQDISLIYILQNEANNDM